jgi:hypothetical protein
MHHYVVPIWSTRISGTRQGPGEGDGPLDCAKLKNRETFDEATATPCQRLFNTQMEHLNSFERPLLGKLLLFLVSCSHYSSFILICCFLFVWIWLHLNSQIPVCQDFGRWNAKMKVVSRRPSVTLVVDTAGVWMRMELSCLGPGLPLVHPVLLAWKVSN